MEIVRDVNIEECLRVGTYVNTHGVRGEIKVYPHTDDVERFSDLDHLYMETKQGLVKMEVKSARYFKNLAILKFKGIDNINDIERYKGSDLYVTRDQAVELEDDEYFICDIIGADVTTDEGEKLGIVKDVLQTGANDVYVIQRDNKKDVLIPVIPSCVLDIDTDEKKVLVHLMPGLID